MAPSAPESPQVSVIVPCWNAARTLPETLASVHAQRFSAWECVIVDDGSPDDCAAIAQSWSARDARFRLVRQPNGGLSAARNRGIHEARGEWLLFLDSDDLIEPAKIASHLARAARSPAMIVYGGCVYFPDGRPDQLTAGRDGSDLDAMPRCSGSGEKILSVLADRNIMPVSAPLVPRVLAQQLDGFDVTLTALEDWEFWIRCARAGATFLFDDAPGTRTHIRLHPASMSSDGGRMFSNERQVRRKHRDLPAMQAATARARKFHLKATLADLLQGHWVLAARHARYALPL